jgi:hypothetical protein
VTKYERVQKEIETGNPPIIRGEIWHAIDDYGEVLRSIRILGEDLHGLIIYEEMPEGKLKTDVLGLGRIPEMNLRYVFRPIREREHD